MPMTRLHRCNQQLAAMLVLTLAALLTGCGEQAQAENGQDYGVVLMYHHVDTDTPRSTSVTPEAFAAHLQYLADNNFNVMDLADLLGAVSNSRPLPPRSVAITFDDAYISVYTQAFPLLRARNWPFTVFVSTNYIDQGFGNYVTWDQLRTMAAAGATMGNHTLTHANLVRMRSELNRDEWMTAVRQEVLAAQARLEEETPTALRVLAYPYGEVDPALETLVQEMNFIGLGQQSGAIGPGTNMLNAPRFPISTGFADMDNFSLRVWSRPMPVSLIGPAQPVLAADAATPTLPLELRPGGPGVAQVNCFASVPGGVTMERDAATNRLRIRANGELPPGRSKYNCTAPVAGERGRFYWYSHLWIKPRPDGSWPPG